MKKHTPGPWRISPSRSCIHVVSADGSFQTGCLLDNAAANAHLIAAAPDLLAACEFSLSVHETQGLYDLSEKAAAEKLRAVIAKARGEIKVPA